MTRTMLDALNPDDIPIDTPTSVLIAAYLGHSDNPASYDQAVARFPEHHIVSIAAHNAVDAQILDIEHGAVEVDDWPTQRGWCVRQLARGVYPTVYVNTSSHSLIDPSILVSANWWAARWSADQTFPAGACGLQYAGQPGYDISVLSDYIEGIDPMTNPLTPAQVEQAVSDGDTAALIPSLQAIYGANGPAAGSIQTIDAKLGQLVELMTHLVNGTQPGTPTVAERAYTLTGAITLAPAAPPVTP